jgi:lipoyl(octanoyl) transferase
METFTNDRGDSTVDQLWLVEHDPVFTLGQAGKPEHILYSSEIPIVPCNRGGQVTYHGPGQLVVYPLFDIRRLQIGIREFVERLENIGISLLDRYGIRGVRRDGAPGVYVAEKKIMAIGLRVRRGCTFHGLAFNVDMDLQPYQQINPCGFQGLQITTLKLENQQAQWPDVVAHMGEEFCREFSMLIVD